MRAALLATVLLACGGPGAPAVVAPAAAPAQVSLPARAPQVSPGERMTYRLRLGGVELAAMTIAVGQPADLDGRRAIVVQSHAVSIGLANLVASVDDTFTSWIDAGTGRPLRFEAQEYETNSKTNIERTIAHLGKREGDVIPVDFGVNEAPQRAEPQRVRERDIWDFNSVLIALRSWEAPAGTRTSLEAFRSRYLWRLDVTIGGRERLTTDLGELPTLRFDARTYRLNRDGTRDTSSEERAFSLWISDDGDRVPLKVKAKTDYGDVTLDIVDYVPSA